MTNYIECSYISYDGVIIPTVEFIRDNDECPEVCEIARTIKKGEEVIFGGGAFAEFVIKGEVEAAR
jgi:hypothetical protein